MFTEDKVLKSLSEAAMKVMLGEDTKKPQNKEEKDTQFVKDWKAGKPHAKRADGKIWDPVTGKAVNPAKKAAAAPAAAKADATSDESSDISRWDQNRDGTFSQRGGKTGESISSDAFKKKFGTKHTEHPAFKNVKTDVEPVTTGLKPQNNEVPYKTDAKKPQTKEEKDTQFVKDWKAGKPHAKRADGKIWDPVTGKAVNPAKKAAAAPAAAKADATPAAAKADAAPAAAAPMSIKVTGADGKTKNASDESEKMPHDNEFELASQANARDKRRQDLEAANKADRDARMGKMGYKVDKSQSHNSFRYTNPKDKVSNNSNSENADTRTDARKQFDDHHAQGTSDRSVNLPAWHKDNGGDGVNPNTDTEKKSGKPGILDRMKKSIENAPGYNSKTGEQTYFGAGKEIKDKDGNVTGHIKKENVGKRVNENTIPTFAGRIVSLVESSYTIKSSDKESIYENIQERFGDFYKELDEGITIKPKNSLNLKMSKELSGVGVDTEDSYTQHETGRGKAYSLRDGASDKEKKSYEKEVASEKAKKFDLSGVTEETKSKRKPLPYHHLDNMTDDEAENHLRQKYNNDNAGEPVKDYGTKKIYHTLDDMDDDKAEKHLKQKFVVDESVDFNPKDLYEGNLEFYSVRHDGVAHDHPNSTYRKLFAGTKNNISQYTKYKKSAESTEKDLNKSGFLNVRIVTHKVPETVVKHNVQEELYLDEAKKSEKKKLSSMEIMKKVDAIRAKQQAKRDADEWGDAGQKKTVSLKSFTQSVKGSRYGGSKQKDDIDESFVAESAMGDLHQTISGHMDKHIENYKSYGGAEHLMSKAGEAANKIAKSHDLNIEHAHSFVRDYIESKMGE